ncbi:unnamed protein product [Arabidopsis lyrata]|nr:unnamed protein product [Arabidopsis lyrata]
MDLESLQTIAFLNAQNDLIDMNEEDAEVQAPEQSETQIQPTQTQQAPRNNNIITSLVNIYSSQGSPLDNKLKSIRHNKIPNIKKYELNQIQKL